jgi:hypothetical protein
MKIVKAAIVLLLGMLLVTSFACGGGAGQGSNPTPITNWSTYTYTNGSHGFIAQYPSDCTEHETEHGIMIVILASGVPSAGAVMLIGVYDAGNATLTDASINVLISDIKLTFPDANISESSATTMGGIPAHKFIYTTSTNNSLMKAMDIHAIKNSRDYTFYYLANASYYPTYLPTVQQMIDSLVIY